ncbi:MAG: hypothetical protein KatS3mg119_2464 [Rhodothalassiaceae bacterium]|nr:MAG: hypothetical protein KatS3mg119_2464 [Rhodothalassiaceae bacterium]
MADIVAVEQIAVAAQRMQALFDQVGDRRLAGTRQPREPQHRRLLALERRACALGDIERLPVDVVGAPQGEIDHPGGHRLIGELVHEDEGAGRPVRPVGIEGDLPVECQIGDPDVVELQGLGGRMLAGVDVDRVFEAGDGRIRPAGRGLEQIGPAGQQRLFGHPHEMRLELVGDLGPRVRMHKEVAARDVDLVFERHGDGLAGDRLLEIAVEGDDPRHPRAPARGQDDDLVTLAYPARGDGAGKAAEVPIRPVDPLDGKSERMVHQRFAGRSLLEDLHQRRPVIPGHAVRAARDIVAEERRDGHRMDRLDAQRIRDAAEGLGDGAEGLLAEIDEIHLVDGEHQLPDAEQRADEGVPARLGDDALSRIDQQHRQIRGRCAGGHVAGVLLVTGRVGDDEAAPVGGEEAVGDVDGDPLLALGLEPVEEQREVDLLAFRPVDAPAFLFQRRELVLEDEARIIEQAADQRRLAVIDAAAGDETQEIPVLLLLQIGGDRRFGLAFEHRVSRVSPLGVPRNSLPASCAPWRRRDRGRSPGPGARRWSPSASRRQCLQDLRHPTRWPP